MADKSKVYETYNKIGSWFDNVRSKDLSFELHHLEALTSHLQKGAKILDLGCGSGRPIAAFLLDQGFKVTAVDGSAQMIELAKQYIPQADIRLIDMRSLNLSEKFDAIIMWHSFFHLTADDQRAIFPILEKHINPQGVLMFTSGTTLGEVWSENGGENLYHASLDTAEYRSLLEKHHFEVLSHTVEDKTAGGATVWLARQK
ncbi:class I SAM-dependent methyltransferase [Bdellovibrio sp. HCB337]|uniref:class I SAM-dependent methyltransferase n=1 Tax=Bdellovibrio sp. HCB337 TaxID=3394358 RepID=UPI0039A4CE58